MNLCDYDLKMSIQGFLSQPDIIEELRLLADSMSSHKALAEKIGISEAYLCDILKGRRNPGVEVCKFLKVEAVLVYKETK